MIGSTLDFEFGCPFCLGTVLVTDTEILHSCPACLRFVANGHAFILASIGMAPWNSFRMRVFPSIKRT